VAPSGNDSSVRRLHYEDYWKGGWVRGRQALEEGGRIVSRFAARSENVPRGSQYGKFLGLTVTKMIFRVTYQRMSPPRFIQRNKTVYLQDVTLTGTTIVQGNSTN
jgi:hypothetical protein